MAKQRTYPAGNRRTAPKRRRKTRIKKAGPAALSAWLDENRTTKTAFATEIAASVQHVSNLCHGHTDPSRTMAVEIERATGGVVTVESWGK